MGLAFAKKSEATRSIQWAERALSWDDFPVIKSIPGNFHAKVYSDIQFEGNREDNSLRIYARMLPHKSGRVSDGIEDMDQLLIHEQLHFDITEYNARLFRKEAISIGKEKLTNHDLQRLGQKYLKQIGIMQTRYDKESQHNMVMPQQRYWELYVAGLLRETATYAEEDIYNYQQFNPEKTDWFRKVYLTVEGEVLTSYPENKKNKDLGEVHRVERKNDSIIISFYKDGKPKAGGYFEAPVCILTFPSSNEREQHLFDFDGTYITSKENAPITRNVTDPEGNLIRTYYDGLGKQIAKKGVFVQTGKWNAENRSIYSSYFDTNGNPTTLDGAFHELREVGENKVTNRISYFDRAGKPMRDNNFISIYEYKVDGKFNLISTKLFDVDGKYALYNQGYHTKYEYNERGNMLTSQYFNSSNNATVDGQGVHKYSFTYDIYDNITDVRKFNARDLPTDGLDEYHHSVLLYDEMGRIVFSALYYPYYVQKFTDQKDGAIANEFIADSLVLVKNMDAYGIESANDNGVSLTKQFLNVKKQVIEERYFDSEGNWAKTADGATSVKYKYDERGNQIERATFDSLGNPRATEGDVAITRWQYDDRKNQTQTTYFNIEDKLANTIEGVTYNLLKYDENDNILESANFNKIMQPSLHDKVHRTTYVVNRFGKDSIVQLFDGYNNLIKGASIILFQYGDTGILESEAVFDSSNKPILDERGIHKTIHNHDKYLRYTGSSYLGINGEAINDMQGISSTVLKLTPSGFLSSISYYDKYGNPVVGPENYHRLENYYNDMDKVVRTTLFGADNNKITNDQGIADYVYQLAATGQVIRVSFYDADANLTEDELGIAEYFYIPDLNGLYFLDKQLNANGDEIPSEEI